MTQIVERLQEAFSWIEQRDLRVGQVWLHPKQVAELIEARDPGWDRIDQRAVMRAFLETHGALLVGHLWGARVFESPTVPENHVGILPDDWDAKLIGSAGCMPF